MIGRMKFAWVLGLGLLACGPVKGSPPGDDDDTPDAEPDDCENNTCECTTATEAADCGVHAICNEAGPGRVCECVAAYASVGGAPCSFAGAPLDKGFGADDNWTLIGTAATIDVGAIGNQDTGVAVFDTAAVCEAGGFKQTFTMPPRDRAEPFKLSVTHSIVDPAFTLGGSVDVAVGGGWFSAPSLRNSFKTDAICLGSRAYDGDKEFLVQTAGSLNCGIESPATFTVDQVAIVPATNGECAEDGTAINGDFDQQSDWTFNPISGATGVIQATGGEANGTAAHLTGDTTCSRASMTGTIALADHVAHPKQAIELFLSGTSGERVNVSLGDRQIGALSATVAGKKVRVCVPSWAHGTHSPITFAYNSTTSGTCNASVTNVFIDSVTVVDEASCDDVDVSDPGFERIANATGPATGWGLFNDVSNQVQGQATVSNLAGDAHTGTGSLKLASSNECTNDPHGDATFIVPAAAGAAGPAVKVFSKSGVNNVTSSTTVAVSLGNKVVATKDLPETGAYVQSVLCIPKELAGRRVELSLKLRDTDGSQSCVNSIPQETAFFDDVEITTDASCP